MGGRTRYLKLDEVAARWACSVATVRRRINAGALAAMRDEHVVRVELEEVERYERDHRAAARLAAREHLV